MGKIHSNSLFKLQTQPIQTHVITVVIAIVAVQDTHENMVRFLEEGGGGGR